jgi:hypothetical protein
MMIAVFDSAVIIATRMRGMTDTIGWGFGIEEASENKDDDGCLHDFWKQSRELISLTQPNS